MPRFCRSLLGAASDDQGPGHQRRGIAGPAGLDRQLVEVYVVALLCVVLAGRVAHHFGAHVQHLFQQRRLVPHVAHAFGGVGLAQVGQQLPDLAQGARISAPIPSATRCSVPNRLASTGVLIAFGVFEQQGRAARAQGAVGDLGHFQSGSTSVWMRTSSPRCSSAAIKSRDLYISRCGTRPPGSVS